MKKLVVLIPLFIVLTAYPDSVSAQVPFSLLISEQLRSTFTLVGTGARAAGMGGAFTAVADDATAASFNPAGLAQLVVPEASVVFEHSNLTDSYRDFIFLDPGDEGELPITDSTAQFSENDLNFLSFTVPFRMLKRGWAVQFSTQKVVDQSYHGDREFDITDPLMNPLIRIRQKNDQTGGIRVYSGSLAVSATRRMLAGITVNRWAGSWRITGLNSEIPVDAPEEAEFLNYTQTNSLTGWNFDLGVLLRYKYANVGIRFRSPFSADYRLEAQVETNIQVEPSEPPLRPLPNTRTNLEWPSTLNIGVALKPSDKLTVAIDYGRTDWSKMLFGLPAGTGEVNFFDLQSPAATRVSTAHVWRIGGEYLFFVRSAVLPVRAGWIHEPQPGVDRVTGNRLITKGYTAGAGVKIEWFAADFAYQRKTSTTSIALFEPDDLAFADLSNPSLGNLHRTENRFFVSAIFQIPRDTFLDRLVRNIFVEPKNTGH